jgi:WD40 repeat protein
MTYLEVIIIDITYGYIIKVIKRVSPPKCIAIIPNQNYMVIHYSDNYCILYDTTLFEEIYVIIGVPGDHRGIKPSDNGRHLLYGNNGGALQMWNVFDCKIELLSHKLKCFSTYEINWDGS